MITDFLTIQKTPNIPPLMIAKQIVAPYEVAGTQIANTLTKHKNVTDPAVSILPNLSLIIPTTGLPIAVPKFSKAVTAAACVLPNPILLAKSERENSNITYPNILTNPQAKARNTSYRRKRRTSNGCSLG
jgi:hypothetical protein